MTKKTPRIEIRSDKNSKPQYSRDGNYLGTDYEDVHWYVMLGANSQVLLQSEMYTRRHDAKRAALRMCAAFGIDTTKTPIVDAVSTKK